MISRLAAVSSPMQHPVVSERNTKLAAFGLPKWLESKCQSCGQPMGLECLMGIEIDLTPRFFGDLVAVYLCGACSGLFEMHYRHAVRSVDEIGPLLARLDPPSRPVEREDVPPWST